MIEQYKFKADAYKTIQKQILIRRTLLIFIILAFVIGINVYNSNEQIIQTDVILKTSIILIPLFIISYFISINKQKKHLESYKLSITEDSITRELLNTPTISISLNDINSITKDNKGNFFVIGKNKLDTIGISYLIENYEQLEKSLNRIKPIEIKNQPSFNQKYLFPLILLLLTCMVAVFVSTNKFIVAICGTGVSAALIWSFIEIQKSKDIDKNTKRATYFIFVVLFSIISNMVVKLSK